MSERAPYVEQFTIVAPAVAQGATGVSAVLKVPFAGTVSAASYTPVANVTGNTSASRTLTLVNKGADGNGTTVIGTLAFATGVDATDYNESAFTLSVVADATTVAAGDVIAFSSAFVGAGLADPGGLVSVSLSRG